MRETMTELIPPDAFTALGHPGRLAVFRMLAGRAPAQVRAGEVAEALALRPNTVSVYVGTLIRAGLVQSRRVATSVYYRVDYDLVRRLSEYLVHDCCGGRPDLAAEPEPEPPDDGPLHVLFLCHCNSARSIMAEALLRKLAPSWAVAHSAGLDPAPLIHPMTLDLLDLRGLAVSGQRPKPLTQYRQPGAPRMDLVVTLCDRTADGLDLRWPGRALQSHWSVADPAMATGAAADRQAAFDDCYRSIAALVGALAGLAEPKGDRHRLLRAIDAIGLRDTAPGPGGPLRAGHRQCG